MKFLEATSRHTDNSIFACQNEEFLLKCQLAQRNEYSHAKRASRIKSTGTLTFTICSIVASIVDCDTLSAISSLFAVGLVVFNKYSDGHISAHKKHAASIQQYIDVTLFASAIGGTKSEWGELPNKTDLAETISEFSGEDTSDMKNWYSDYSSLPGEAQVFHCQRENVRWDYGLHKSYICLQLGILLAAVVAMIVTMFIVNPDFIKLICILSWLTPLAEYTYSACKDVFESISILRKINSFCDQIENKLSGDNVVSVKQELIDLQYKIRERREVGFLIPDWFYKMRKGKHQKQEDSIAETIVNLNQENGEQR